MSAELLQQLVSSGRVTAPNYFNGRLLSAGDLTQERAAGRQLLARVGRAAGAGVALGFEVAAVGDWTVQVAPGLAVCPRGGALELGAAAQVTLVPARDLPSPVPAGGPVAPAADPGRFTRCAPSVVAPPTLATSGVYVLAIGPKCGGDGSVPTSSLAGGASCAVRDRYEGLRFELISLDPGATPEPPPATEPPADRTARLSRFRSRAARPFFRLTDAPTPWDAHPASGDLLPLALIYLQTGTGIGFVDVWPVRRPAGFSSPLAGTPDAAWDALLGRSRRREVEAMVRQFIGHAAEVANRFGTEPALTTVAADRLFAWLPPVGVLPGLFDRVAFFGPRFVPPEVTLVPAQAARVLADGLDGDPIALTPPPRDLVSVFTDAVGGFVLFASRRRPRGWEGDAAAEAFGGARRAFSQLAERGDLAPLELTSGGALVAWTAVQTRLGAVVAYAAGAEAGARAGGLGPEALAAALAELGRLEAAAVEAARNVLGLLTDPAARSRRKDFLDDVSALLTAPAGGPEAVLTQLQAGDLPGAVRAQLALDRRVAGYAGDPVGAFVVRPNYTTSLDGPVVIPGGPETRHRFALANPNDQDIRVQVRPRVAETPVGQDWSGVARVSPAEFRVPRGGAQTVDVFAQAPPGAALNTKVRLFLDVTVVESGFRSSADVQLTVAAAGTGPTPSRLDLRVIPAPGSRAAGPTVLLYAGLNQPFTFRLFPGFSPVAAETRALQVAVQLAFEPATARDQWTFTVNDAAATLPANNLLLGPTTSVPATTARVEGPEYKLVIFPPATAGSACTLTAVARSPGLADGAPQNAQVTQIRIEARNPPP